MPVRALLKLLPWLALLSVNLGSAASPALTSRSTPPSSPATPEHALEALEAGNARFVAGTSTSKPPAVAQTTAPPQAVVLSCSDSRYPSEQVFDQRAGELYDVRVGANMLGGDSMASIEDAVQRLGVPLIIVLGHGSCDLVRAAVDAPLGKSAGSPDLDALIAAVKSGLQSRRPAMAGSLQEDGYRNAVIQNVDAVAARILQRSRIVRSHVLNGNLKIVRAIFSPESGKVDFWHEPKNAVLGAR